MISRSFISTAAALVLIGGCAALPTATGETGDLAFVGRWSCEGGAGPAFTLTRSTYQVEGGPTGAILIVERRGSDFLVTLVDGYRISLFDVTGSALTWHSPQSGDTFDCVKTAAS